MTHPESARVVICGAGVIGAAVAYYLSLRGVAATVIERCGVACAASGKSGGFLALDWCDNSPLAPLARKSFQLHAELAQTLGVDYGYRRLTTLAVAAGAHGLTGSTKVPEELAWLDSHGVPYAVLGTPATTAQVHPARFTQALLQAALARGAQLRIGCVDGLEMSQGQVQWRACGWTASARRYSRNRYGPMVGTRRCLAAAPARVGPEGPQHHLAAHHPGSRPGACSWTMSLRLVSASRPKSTHARTGKSISAASLRRSRSLRVLSWCSHVPRPVPSCNRLPGPCHRPWPGWSPNACRRVIAR